MRFLTPLKREKSLTPVIVLGLILIVGAVLRAHNLDYRTLDHPEVYSPGIDLPWGLTNPNPRFTLWQTLAGSIGGEPHPPGFYILMLGWTELFGSSIVSLRAPSLLFGIASILLIYILARWTEDALTGLFAASMLALNGLHLYWSQNARMYSMGCFLGLLSTVLLVLIVKHAARQRIYGFLYLIVTVAGVATHAYFWFVFAAQGLWVLLAKSWREQSSQPHVVRLQILTFIAATPLMAIALFQTETATRPRTLSPLTGVSRFLQLGSLLETDSVVTAGASFDVFLATFALFATVFFFACAVLTKRGSAEDPRTQNVEEYRSPRLAVTATVGVLMALGILGFAYYAKALVPGRTTQWVIAASFLPIALVFIDFCICRYWQRSNGLRVILTRKFPWPESLSSLNFFLAVLPVTILAIVSLFNPMFIPRGTLLFVPYLLIVIGSGLASLVRRDRRWVFIVLILLTIHGSSILYFKSKPSNPDYKGLAERWVPRIDDSDLIFVHGRGRPGDWAVAPIFYYLNGARYRFAGTDFAKAVHSYPSARVWVLSLAGFPTEQDITNALSGYRLQERLDARNVFVQLYVPEATVRSSKQWTLSTQIATSETVKR